MYISVIAYPLFFLLSLHYHSAIKYTLKKTIYIGKGIIYIHEFCNNAIHKSMQKHVKCNMSWVYKKHYIDGLVQERPKSIVNGLELRLSRTDLSI